MDPAQIDALVDTVAERLTDRIVERVIEKIAEFGDEPDDLGAPDDLAGEPPMPEDLGGEQMAASGPAFLPGHVGAEGGDDDGDIDQYEDDLDDVDDEEMPPEEDLDGDDDAVETDDDLGDEGDDEGGEDDSLPPDDEEDEQYMAGDRMIPGKKTVRHESHCDHPKGKKMSKQTYKADPAQGVSLERYSDGEDPRVIRYQREAEKERSLRVAAEKKAEREKSQLMKTVERYSSRLEEVVSVLVARDRIDALKALQAEGYDLDIEEEMGRTERYGNDEFDAHLDVIRTRYRRESDDDDLIPTRDPIRSTDPDSDDRSVSPYEIARYASDHSDDLRGLSPEEKASKAIEAFRASRVRDGAR